MIFHKKSQIKIGDEIRETIQEFDTERETTIKHDISKLPWYFAPHSVGDNFLSQLYNTQVSSGYADQRQVLRYYRDGKLLCRAAHDNNDEGHMVNVYAPEFRELCHSLLDQALDQLKIEQIEDVR